MINKLKAFWNKSVTFLKKAQWIPIVLTRITIGFTFTQTGWGKLHNLDQVTEFFRTLSIPAPEIQAPFVAGVELICGVLILFGLATRLACIPLIATMVVAILTAKLPEITSWADLFGFIEFLYIVLLGFLLTYGPGFLSIDRIISRKSKSPI